MGIVHWCGVDKGSQQQDNYDDGERVTVSKIEMQWTNEHNTNTEGRLNPLILEELKST
jgi:hypothetical protein